ncbi:hypothetical protein tloyanaT_17330 [Thalassotalea loyana]|uniref:Uncharacterized protein n=1 Tax=Thalassotalea loyana TaxID=280483 RepID=A0ABQ6HBI9_9GAMM|nr:hypothetical protein [Thalassotalea loyana]GLX85481.1 hypothetical protein tloyanaT_17330 [Thalassotalea loyana]
MNLVLQRVNDYLLIVFTLLVELAIAVLLHVCICIVAVIIFMTGQMSEYFNLLYFIIFSN